MNSRATFVLLGVFAAAAAGCTSDPVVLSEPVAPFSMTTIAGDKVDVPSTNSEVLLYFFASW